LNTFENEPVCIAHELCCASAIIAKGSVGTTLVKSALPRVEKLKIAIGYSHFLSPQPNVVEHGAHLQSPKKVGRLFPHQFQKCIFYDFSYKSVSHFSSYEKTHLSRVKLLGFLHPPDNETPPCRIRATRKVQSGLPLTHLCARGARATGEAISSTRRAGMKLSNCIMRS
jgi:hypothetical protein